MKLLQRILSRGLLISLAILAAIGWHFRANLFPQWYGPEAQAKQEQRETPQTAADIPDAPPPASAQPVGDAAPPASVEPVAQAPAAAPAPVYAPVEPDAAVANPPAAPADTAPQLSAADASAPPSAGTRSGVKLLAGARAAYWSQDYADAERMYRELAAADTASADPLGELGNLYYAQGRWDEAAEAYAGAIERLIAQGDQARARHLMMFLDGLDPGRAQAVRTAQGLDGR